MNQDIKETLQGQLQEIEEIFESIQSMEPEMSTEEDRDIYDELLLNLDHAQDNIKLLIQ